MKDDNRRECFFRSPHPIADLEKRLHHQPAAQQSQKMSTHSVSVVIPAYNTVAFLSQAVESVLDQTFTDFEIIIVADLRSDDIVQWVKQIAAPQIKLISQENQGRSVAFNHGIKLSQGEYVAFLDADDLWESTKLEKQLALFARDPKLGLVDTWMFLVDEQETVLSQSTTSFAGDVWLEMLKANLIACGSSPLVRRQCFDKVGWFEDIQGFEDWHLWTRIAAHYPFDVVEEPLVHHRQQSDSTARSLDLMISNRTQAIEDLYQSVPSDLLWKKRQSYGCAYLDTALLAYRSERYRQAISFFWRAFQSYPRFCLTKAHLKVLVKSLLYLWLGTQRSAQFKNVAQILLDSPEE